MARKMKTRKPKVDKPNPFELKFTRKKNMTKKGAMNYQIAGKPLAAKSKAIEKRTKTIGVEFDRLGVVNEVKDARIAENAPLSREEKAAHRFVALKRKNFTKKKFNLDDAEDVDDDELEFLPKDKDLSQVQMFERIEANAEEDGLNPDVIALTNFGGGQLNLNLQTEEGGESRRLSRKEILENVIAKSKEGKLISQMAKDELVTMTENLDERFKNINKQGLLASHKKKNEKLEEVKGDDYDEIYNSLLFDTKRKAIPVLSEKQKAEKDAAKLVELEKQRLKRMKDDSDESDVDGHIAADEEIRPAKKKQKKDKTAIIFDENGKGKIIPSKESLEKMREDEHVGTDEEPIFDDEEEMDGEDMDEDEDDLEDEEGEDEEADLELEEENDESIEALDVEDEANVSKQPVFELKTRNTTGSIAGSHMPFVFDMPTNFQSFCDIYSAYFDDQWQVLTDRLIKCHHPSLKPTNKAALGKVFKFALRFFDTLAQRNAFDQLKSMIAVLKKYLQIYPLMGAVTVRALLAHKRKHYAAMNGKKAVTFDLIAFFILVSELFPTSDAYHPVCTPTFYFLLEVLGNCRIDSIQTAGVSIYVTKIVCDWIVDSQRYVPELIRSTRLLLSLAVKRENGDLLNDPLCFSNVSRKSLNILMPKNVVGKLPKESIHLKKLFGEKEDLDESEFCCCLLRSLLQIVRSTVNLYDSLKLTFDAIFEPQLQLLNRIDKKNCPREIVAELDGLIETIGMKIQQYSPRSQRQRKVIKKIKMIKMLDPVIEEDFDTSKPNRGVHKRDPEREEKRLKKLIKGEKRGVIKELRMDAKFIANAQQKKKEALKSERDFKTRKIIATLQGQESEYKKNHFKPSKF